MYNFTDIRTLQLEISSYCNAACPQCPRNYFGGKTIPTLPLHNWSLNTFKKLFSKQLLAQLEMVYFCGTYGDPMTNKNIVAMCKFIKDNNPRINIGIHTNGGIGKTENYARLAKHCNFIAFGIDGLEDTNHIYRRNVNWNKVITNSTAFIKNGGYAIWDFIVFKHNQHQVEQAKLFSQSLNFAEFNIKKTARFFTRDHKLTDSLSVYNKQGFIDYAIFPPDMPAYLNDSYKELNKLISKKELQDYTKSVKIKCNAMRVKEVYIGADGFVFPCGWLHDRLHGPEIEGHEDQSKIKKLMLQAGGWEIANIFHTPLDQIVNGPWFKKIAQSWNSPNRLERCAMMCGKDINPIGKQNSNISYKE